MKGYFWHHGANNGRPTLLYRSRVKTHLGVIGPRRHVRRLKPRHKSERSHSTGALIGPNAYSSFLVT